MLPMLLVLISFHIIAALPQPTVNMTELFAEYKRRSAWPGPLVVLGLLWLMYKL